jgi:hypothetical protein
MGGDRSGNSLAKAAGGLLIAVILINVVPRLVGMPNVDLPSIWIPELPGWVHTVLRVKNVALGVLVVAVIALAVAGERGKRG